MSFIEPNVYFLRQGIDLMEAIDRSLFVRTGGIAGRRGSIGAHTRHCIDSYRCFLHGLAGRRIDYDARQRDSGVETDPRRAAAALREIIAALEEVEAEDPSRPLAVRVDAPAWEASTLDWSDSTVGRELQFLLSHTVHHFALIAMLARSLGFEPGDTFGVAPSTLAFERRPVSANAGG